MRVFKSLRSATRGAALLWLCLAALQGCSDSKSDDADETGDDPFSNANDGEDNDGEDNDDDGTVDEADEADDDDNAGANAGNGGSNDPAADWSGLPSFPGSGTSDAGDPLPNGMLCDSVPGQLSPIPDPIRECYVDKNDPTQVAATLEQVLECVEEADTVHVRLTFHPWFVDNTYGENAIGWDEDGEMAPAMMPGMDMMGMMKPPKMGKGGHTFKDLVGSDHAEIILKDADGTVVMQFKLDYLSEDGSAPSGYASLGVTGGEGKMIIGDASGVVRWMTSEDRNLNERGFASYTTDSPATDEDYTPNPETPEWDYRVVYEAWIDIDVFGEAGFGGALIEFVHASPSKADSNTIEVEPGDCPPPPGECGDDDPDENCGTPPPPPPGSCGSDDPDAVCADGGVPQDAGQDEPGPNCEDDPESCMVD